MQLEDYLSSIAHERAYQSAKWGNEFDDQHNQNDWVAFITAYAGKGMRKDKYAPDDKYPNPVEFRSAMIKVATLAVAALEALDRSGA